MSETVVPVAVVRPEDLAGLPEPVLACASCGYLGVRPPLLGEGGVPGSNELMTVRVCPRCGHQGPPVEFATRADYAAFVRGLQDHPSVRA